MAAQIRSEKSQAESGTAMVTRAADALPVRVMREP